MASNAVRAAAPDQEHATLSLKQGKNRLLLKVSNVAADWAVYFAPDLPESWPKKIRDQYRKDFPPTAVASSPKNNAEAEYYRIVTLPVPKECVLEVGGLAFRPDGKLLACTRRGEVWLIPNPTADEPRRRQIQTVRHRPARSAGPASATARTSMSPNGPS